MKYGATTLEEGKDFKVTYKDNTKVSTADKKAKVILTGKGNYTGTREATFNILRTVSPTTPPHGGGDSSGISISSVSIKAIPNQPYTGKPVKPVPVLRYNGKKLKKGTDFTLAYANNKSIGKATVTVTGKGFFTGTRRLYFNIVPKGTAFTKATSLKKAIRLQWKKVVGITGYEIQYTLANQQSGGGFKVNNAKQTIFTLNNLATGMIYEIRIRTYVTVKGRTYYSAWSKVRKVKTK